MARRDSYLGSGHGPLLVLGLLGACVCNGPAHGATLRFQPALYEIAESTADLRVTLAVSVPECAGEVEVLETTARIRAEADGTATSSVDFAPLDEAVPVGGSRLNVSHLLRGLIVDDTTMEGPVPETFRLSLSLPADARVRCTADDQLYDLVAEGQATVKIDDDEANAQPLLRIAGGRPVREGGEGTTDALFRVSLSRASFNAVTVDVTTEGCRQGTAKSGEDYTPLNRRLTFLYPETEKQLAVQVHGDTVHEPDESFWVCLSNAQSATIAPGKGAARGTIQDDDGEELKLTKVSGDQEGSPGQRLPNPLVVRVTRGRRLGVEHVAIAWAVTSGDAQLSARSNRTGAGGRARIGVTLGPRAGPVQVTATAEGIGTAVTFDLNAHEPKDPIPPDELCAHPDLLPPKVRAECRRRPPGPPPDDWLPRGSAGQATVGREGLGLHRQMVEGRLRSLGEQSPQAGRTQVYGGAGTSSGSRPSSEREAGYEYSLRDFAGGVDRMANGRLLLGAAVGYLGGQADYLGGGGTLDLRALCVSAYGAYQGGGGAYHLVGILTWGRPRFDTERIVVLSELERLRARSSSKGSLWDLSLEGGGAAHIGRLELEGHGSLRWSQSEIGTYGEHGAEDFNLLIDGRRQRWLVAGGGVRAQYTKTVGSSSVTIYLSGNTLHELSVESPPVFWRFAKGPHPEQTFVLTTDRPDRDYFDFEAGLSAGLPGSWRPYVSFRKEVQREDLASQSLLFGVLFKL